MLRDGSLEPRPLAEAIVLLRNRRKPMIRATANVRNAMIALAALGAAALSPTILWAMPQPGTCAGYYPVSPKIWLACDTSKFSKRIALGCSVAKPCLRLQNGDGSSNRRQSDSCCRSHARDCKGEFGLCLCVLGQVQGCLCECPGATRGL